MPFSIIMTIIKKKWTKYLNLYRIILWYLHSLISVNWVEKKEKQPITLFYKIHLLKVLVLVFVFNSFIFFIFWFACFHGIHYEEFFVTGN